MAAPPPAPQPPDLAAGRADGFVASGARGAAAPAASAAPAAAPALAGAQAQKPGQKPAPTPGHKPGQKRGKEREKCTLRDALTTLADAAALGTKLNVREPILIRHAIHQSGKYNTQLTSISSSR